MTPEEEKKLDEMRTAMGAAQAKSAGDTAKKQDTMRGTGAATRKNPAAVAIAKSKASKKVGKTMPAARPATGVAAKLPYKKPFTR
jgi:hypothetical protein